MIPVLEQPHLRLAHPAPDDPPTTDLVSSRAVGMQSTEELVKELRELGSTTAAVFSRMADVLSELRRRGVEINLYSPTLSTVLPMISAGDLTPEAASAFCDTPALLKNISKLPLDEQRRLASGGRVLVIPAVGEAPVELTARQVYDRRMKHVFLGGQVLNPELQTKQLVAKQARTPAVRQPAPPRRAPSPESSRPGVPPPSATEEEIARLAARLDSEVRSRGNVRLTVELAAQLVATCGWIPGHREPAKA